MLGLASAWLEIGGYLERAPAEYDELLGVLARQDETPYVGIDPPAETNLAADQSVAIVGKYTAAIDGLRGDHVRPRQNDSKTSRKANLYCADSVGLFARRSSEIVREFLCRCYVRKYVVTTKVKVCRDDKAQSDKSLALRRFAAKSIKNLVFVGSVPRPA